MHIKEWEKVEVLAHRDGLYSWEVTFFSVRGPETFEIVEKGVEMYPGLAEAMDKAHEHVVRKLGRSSRDQPDHQ